MDNSLKVNLLLGNCLVRMKEMAENSVDSIVTDSPYGLSFMGKKWDYDVPTTEIWAECLRVLKPGGHLLAFFGTRTYHRGVIRIEDAGFEIRDQIMWIYGSGFPKSHDVSKGIDKQAGAEREILGLNPSQIGRKTANQKSYVNTVEFEGMGEVVGQREAFLTAPKTDAAKQWQGWGTALKPANEPIVVARKPLEKGLTIAENVIKWGTGALNIDASRIGPNPGYSYKNGPGGNTFSVGNGVDGTRNEPVESTQGRWPANVLFDEQAAEVLDAQSGILRQCSTIGQFDNASSNKFSFTVGNQPKSKGIKGFKANIYAGASRFFYVAKASKRERNAGLEGMPLKGGSRNFNDGMEYRLQADGSKTSATQLLSANHHPTVKPIKLMEYLITLVTPPNGSVLDPFMGSGSTGVAAKNLNRDFIGIELDEVYFEIAKRRVNE